MSKLMVASSSPREEENSWAYCSWSTACTSLDCRSGLLEDEAALRFLLPLMVQMGAAEGEKCSRDMRDRRYG